MLALAAGLRATCRVSVACPPSSGGWLLLGRAGGLGVTTDEIDPTDGEGLAHWLDEGQPDILHVHAGIGWEGHLLVEAGRRADVPVLLRTEHLPYVLTDPGQRREHAQAVASVDRLICVSEAARDSYVAAGLAPEKLVTIRNGIEPVLPSDDARPRLRRALGISPTAPIILTVARMTPQKGHLNLIEAAPTVLARRPDAVFVLVGTGPLEGELRRHVREHGLDAAVLLLGARRDVPELLAAADLFVLPSHFEGLSLVVLEAMAAGLPVVGTRIGGTEETVVHGGTGLLVRPGDPLALAVSILELLADRARARTLGEAGRLRFLAEFQAGRMTAELLELYRTLVAPGRARPSAE